MASKKIFAKSDMRHLRNTNIDSPLKSLKNKKRPKITLDNQQVIAV